MAQSPLPGPNPFASGTVAGLISTAAQTVGDGVKTFLKAIGLGALASDPSGSSNGWLYYNTNYHLLRIKAGGIWRAISTTYLYPEEYGAIIDSTASATVNTAALQSAFDASVSQGRTVYLSKGNYYVDGGISATGEVHAIGGGLGASLITADTTFVGDAVIEVNGAVRFESFGVNAARETKYPFYFEGSSQAVFQSVGAYNGTFDGFHMPQSGVNDRLTFIECQASGNGTLYHTPGLDYSALSGSMRVSKIWGINTTSGSNIITGNGGAGEFLTMGLRQGDLIRVGSSSPDLFEIDSVDSENQITAFNAATATRTSAEWGAGIGWGYYEARHNDNNINLLIGGLYRSNAGGGVAFQGLYGSRAYNVQIDNQPLCGLKCGNGEGPTYNALIDGCYFEGIEGGLGPAVLFSYAYGVSARQNMVEGTTTKFKALNPAAAHGTWEGKDYIESIGSAAAYEIRVPVDRTGVSGFTLNSALLENSQLLSVTGTIPMLPTVVHGQCYFGGSSVTNTATPTIAAGTEGQVFTLQNFSSAYTVTLQDNGTLSGSNLQLKTPTVTLDGLTQDSITFMYLGGTWYERSRSVAADIGGTDYISAISDTSTIDLTETSGTLSAAIVAGSVGNTEIATGAAIARSKLATATANTFATNDASGVLSPTAVTASRAVATDSNGLPVASATTATELGYVNGVTSAIQTQLNTKVDTVSNAGAGAGTLASKSGTTLTVKSIAAGSGITVTNNANDVTIAASGGGGVTGSGTTNKGTYWTSSSAVGAASMLNIDTANNRMGINEASPWVPFVVRHTSTGQVADFRTASNSGAWINVVSEGTNARALQMGPFTGEVSPSAAAYMFSDTSDSIVIGQTNDTYRSPIYFRMDGQACFKIGTDWSVSTSSVFRPGSLAGSTIDSGLPATPDNGSIVYNTTTGFVESRQSNYWGPLGTQRPITTTAKTANYTATARDHKITFDATSGNLTCSLPAASSCPGKEFIVIKTDASANTVTVNGKVLAAQYDSALVVSNGSSWINPKFV